MVSTHYPFTCSPVLCHLDARSGQYRIGKKSVGAGPLPEQPGPVQGTQGIAGLLIPYTLPEVLRLVWLLVWQQVIAHAHTLCWSLFRRHHQAVAQAYHYKRRLARASPELQL